VLASLAEAADKVRGRIRRGSAQLNTDETDPKVVKARQLNALKKRGAQMEQLSIQAKSDLIELRRDLATYEHTFAQQTHLSSCLIRLSGLANGLTTMQDTLVLTTEEEEARSAELKAELRSLDALEVASCQHELPMSSLLCKEDFGSRPDQSLADFLIYQGAGYVSGLAVMLRVTGNYYYKHLSLDLQTISGESFFLRIDLPKLPSEGSSKYFKASLLKKFYFIFERHELKLCYHERCNRDFLALLVQLKGSTWGYHPSSNVTPNPPKQAKSTGDAQQPGFKMQGCHNFVNSVFLSQSGYEVTIRMQNSSSFISVGVNLITDKESIFSESPQKLCRLLSRHLLVNEDLHLIEWFESATQLFSVKEQESRLMDDIFVTTFMKQDEFLPFLMIDVEVKGQTYAVLMLVCKGRTKFEITRNSVIKTIAPRSTLMKTITELQFTNLSKAVQTLRRSLEFEMVVSRLFEG
jgi:hypothetical protein